MVALTTWNGNTPTKAIFVEEQQDMFFEVDGKGITIKNVHPKSMIPIAATRISWERGRVFGLIKRPFAFLFRGRERYKWAELLPSPHIIS